MAEEVNYRIIITDDTGEHEITPVASPDTQGSSPSKGSSLSKSKAEKSSENGTLASTLVAVKQVEPYVNVISSFAIDSISFTTGSKELQQRASIVSNFAQQMQNIGLSAAIGGVGGAVIASANTMIMNMLSLVVNTAKIEQSKKIEDESIGRRKSKLGQTVNRSRNGGIA